MTYKEEKIESGNDVSEKREGGRVVMWGLSSVKTGECVVYTLAIFGISQWFFVVRVFLDFCKSLIPFYVARILE